MPLWNYISLALVILAVAFQYYHLERLHRAEMDSISRWGRPTKKLVGPKTGFLIAMGVMMIALLGIVIYFAHLASKGWMSSTVFIISTICLLGFLIMIAIMFVRDIRIKRGK
jgi:hypothetical protein